ncbi:MAG: alpha/beta fold hydrolase [Acidimicrobiia bacterium]|nr:alpha/beta fold hydrolase [Acidimicrobiia bacterium]
MSALIGLHGFTQAGRMFDELSHYLPRHIEAPDLPGHGASSDLPATFESVVGLIEWLAGGEPPVLIGYSMGGRLALRYALERPVAGLVLISAGPGIAHPAEREERRINDEGLAAGLAVEGVEAFIDQWLGNPMFGGLTKRHEIWRAVDRETRLLSSAEGLARALVGYGQGSQPYLGDRLAELRVPTLIVAGADDAKYVAIARTMHGAIDGSRLAIIEGVGHAVVGEDPAELGDLISRFLY